MHWELAGALGSPAIFTRTTRFSADQRASLITSPTAFVAKKWANFEALVGLSVLSTFAHLSSARVSDILGLNVVALTCLAWAAIGPMLRREHGTIINIGSVVALPHLPNAAHYAGTKAFVLTITRALAGEAANKNLRFQAVLPGATRTNIWVKSGLPAEHLPQEIVMETGELVTIPALSGVTQCQTAEAARHALATELSKAQPAARYRA